MHKSLSSPNSALGGGYHFFNNKGGGSALYLLVVLAHGLVGPSHVKVTMEPASRVELHDAEKFMKLIERSQYLDDTQEVYHNAEISDEVMVQL